jgi:putative FmdB family regulatory protein
MPIYEYRCRNGHTFDVMQRMSDDPVRVCEVCESPVGKVFNPIAVHFKGSGFYNTDYGTRKRSREMSEAKASNGDGPKKDKDKSSDSKSSDAKSPKSDSGAKKTESKAAAAD